MSTPIPPVQFGTSGHRGIIADTFTQRHVEAIAWAVAQLLPKNATIAIGCDPRTGNDPDLKKGSFTQICVDTLRTNGVNVIMLTPFIPTPVVSWYITTHHLDGGFVLTASHNPPQYNGIKFNQSNGAPASSEITTQIERLANNYLASPPSPHPLTKKGSLTIDTPISAFAHALLSTTESLLHRPLTIPYPIAIDPKHGTAGQVWQALLGHLTPNLHLIHQTPLSDFGNINPNPTKLDTLTALKTLQKTTHSQIAISNDPDADRHVILDDTGTALTPEETTVIIGDYLLSQNLPLKSIISTVASSRILDEFCTKNGLTLTRTPVGFKHFAPHLDHAKNTQTIAIAVESSGGFSASFHTMEKCGFLPIILILYAMATTQKSLSELRLSLAHRYGTHRFDEVEFHFKPDQKDTLTTLLLTPTLADLIQETGLDIDRIDTQDGLKLILKNTDWILIRLSGTEPVARLYAESDTHKSTQTLLTITQHWLSRSLS